MRCGNCKGAHDTVALVRECFAGKDGTPSPKQVSLAHALGRERVRLPQYANLSNEEYGLMIAGLKRSDISPFIREMLKQPNLDGPTMQELLAQVDHGRYALYNEDDDDIRFYFVSGRNEKYRKVFQLIGAPGDFRQHRIYRANKILARIAADPMAALVLYGLNVGVCGRCHSPLTKKRTREQGIGDDCKAKMEGEGA